MAKFIDRTDEEGVASNGQKMTIYKYYNAKRIDVKFEDGTIVKDKTYSHFKTGSIKNPNCKTMHGISKNELIMSYYFSKIGFSKKEKNKEKEFGDYEYDLLNRSLKLAIEYDGDPRTHTKAKDEKKNKDAKRCGVTIFRLRTPEVPCISGKYVFNIKKSTVFGKKFEKTLKDVLTKINLVYKTDFDIDINFERDKDDILEYIKNDFCINTKDYVNSVNIAKNGQKMTIKKFYSLSDIEVEFEDKTIVKNKTYYNFLTGNIGNPNYNIQHETLKQKRIHETNVSRSGQKIEIIDYITYQDITVKFEDGTIVKHKKYTDFKNGKISNPSVKSKKAFTISKRDNKNYIGQMNIANNGQEMTIIDYFSPTNINVKFEDGTIVKNKNYQEFKRGNIANPNFINPKFIGKIERKGETNVMHNGQTATIIEYFNNKNITIQFEDGTVVKNKKYSRFLSGNIGNPNFSYR